MFGNKGDDVKDAALRQLLKTVDVGKTINELARAMKIESGQTPDPAKSQAYLDVARQVESIRVPEALKPPPEPQKTKIAGISIGFKRVPVEPKTEMRCEEVPVKPDDQNKR